MATEQAEDPGTASGDPPAAQSPEEISASEELRRRQREILVEYINEQNSKLKWKRDLRQINSSVESRPEETDLRKLDSSLKKNTAFIRKLKNFTAAQKDAILKEISTLNLTKYIGEATGALIEAKIKMTDLQAAIEIASVLHRKYADFAPTFVEAWQRNLPSAASVKAGNPVISNPSKFRVDLRFYSDLIATGVFTLKEGLPTLGQTLMLIVNNDKEDHNHLPLLIAFCKFCGDDYAGVVPRKISEMAAEFPELDIPKSDLLHPDKQRNVRHLLKEYFHSVTAHLLRDHKEVRNIERTNRKILIKTGEVHDERKEKAESLQVTYAKLLTNTEIMADLLDEDMPEFPKEEIPKEEGLLLIDDADNAEGEVEVSALGQLWEDDETKAFYEHIVDLKPIVPAILYRDSSKEKASTPSAEESEVKEENEDPEVEEENDEEIQKELENMEDMADNEEIKPPDVEDDEEPSENQNASSKMLFDAFLAKIETCISREMIDSAAVDFCMSHNTRNNRKKLVKVLFGVHRNRADLLPFYSRLVATLEPLMPEVPVDLAQYLKQEFRWQVRKKDQMKIESKLKVCRFIGEMVKFRMFAKSEAFFCLKQLLFDFSHHHIDMACVLMETCGRYLLRTPDSHRRAKIYLEQMMRKKTAISMDSKYAMMIENAYYNVNPPTDAGVKKAERLKPPMQKYIEKLLYNDLSRHSMEKVLRQFRKLDWNDSDTAAYVFQTVNAIWRVKYFNIQYAASMLAGLADYQEWICPRIVDGILEDIRLMMEVNDPKYNQRRVSVVKFFAELYNYRLVDSALVFKVLYSIISFGVSPDPFNQPSYLDPPDHLLRIRLVTVILDTCGMYFSGSSKQKLDYFLVYFQRYYWLKRVHPIWQQAETNTFPVAVVYNVEETIIALRPKSKPYKTLEAALEASLKTDKEMLADIRVKAPDFKKYLEPQQQRQQNEDKELHTISEDADENEENANKTVIEVEVQSQDNSDVDDSEDEESEDESRSDSRNENKEDDDDDDSQDDTQESGGEESLDESDDDEDDDLADENSFTTKGPQLIKCEEDDDFVAMFDKMMTTDFIEAKGSRGAASNQQIDIVTPGSVRMIKKQPDIPPLKDENAVSNSVQFTLLMKKGNKPAYKDLDVPADSEMAMNLARKEEADRLEKERVKQLTLQINERQEQDEMNEAIASMQRPSVVSFQQRPHKKFDHPKGVPDNVDALFGKKFGK